MVTRKIPSKPRATRKRTAPKPTRELAWWEEVVAIGKSIPPEELATFPMDGASNLHHYLHGAPKQDPD